MGNRWKSIWGSKTVLADNQINLDNLIKLNGFDSGFSNYDATTWKLLVADVCSRTKLSRDQRVLELGCGSGAFLWQIGKFTNAKLYGIDYSENLINVAQKAIPDGKFNCCEANASTFENIWFDSIISHGVFFYFPTHEYVEAVLRLWCSKIKTRGTIVLLDLNDSRTKLEYLRQRKLAYSSTEDYEKDYDGLNHLFFDREQITDMLKKFDMTNIEFFPHAVQNYKQSKYRFNVIATKT